MDSNGLIEKCNCGVPALKLVTKKDNENKGRPFLSCQKKKCRFFKWDDSTNKSNNNNSNISNNNNNNNKPKYPFSKEANKLQLNKHNNNKSNKISTNNSSNSPIVNIPITILSKNVISIHVPKVGKVATYMTQRRGAYWDSVHHCWNMPLIDHDRIVEELDKFGKVIPVPQSILNVFKINRLNGNNSPDFNSGSSIESLELESDGILLDMKSKILPNIYDKLLPFQKEGVREAIIRNGRVLIADEMGLGKTLQAITISNYYKSSWPCIIICPSSLRHNWRNEISKWLLLDKDRIMVIESGKDAYNLEINNDIDFYIFSYEIATKSDISQLIRDLNFQFIVCDECHYLKNKDAKRTQMLLPILKSSPHVLLLSGTPALSRPIELYTQISALLPNFMDSVDYAQRYCDAKMTRFGWDFTGSSNMDELHAFLNKTILIRRQKDIVLQQLPKKIRHCVDVKLDEKSMIRMQKLNQAYKEINQKLELCKMKGDNKGEKEAVVQRRTLMIEMYSETGRGKIHAIKTHVLDLLEHHNDKKFIIFGHHLEILNEIQTFLDTSSIPFIRIDGTTSVKERQNLIDRFQEEEHVKCALLSITAAGVGLTLTKADQVIFAELFWNPAQLFQGEDRAHRIGRVGNVHVFYYIAEKSLDDVQWPLLERKLKVVTQSLDGKKKSINTVNSTVKKGTAVNAQKTIDSFFKKPDVLQLETTKNKSNDINIDEKVILEDITENKDMIKDINSTADGFVLIRESQILNKDKNYDNNNDLNDNKSSFILNEELTLLDDFKIFTQEECSKINKDNKKKKINNDDQEFNFNIEEEFKELKKELKSSQTSNNSENRKSKSKSNINSKEINKNNNIIQDNVKDIMDDIDIDDDFNIEDEYDDFDNIDTLKMDELMTNVENLQKKNTSSININDNNKKRINENTYPKLDRKKRLIA